MSGRVSQSHPIRLPSGRLLLSPIGLTLLGLAQLADFATFGAMMRLRGPAAEVNPIALTLQDHGLFLALAAKLTVWALVAAIAAVIAPSRPNLARFVILFGIIVGIVGTLSNLATI